jgi:alkyldihydroxyacetonephosphate synthase
MCHTVAVTETIDHTRRDRWADTADTAETAETASLPPHALRWLIARTGLRPNAGPHVQLTTPDSALPDDARADLVDLLGADRVLVDADSRLGRAGGLSYLDLLRRRRADDIAVPDAVLLPDTPEQVTAVLAVAARHDLAVVPFGGGTSVVGGVTALRAGKPAVIALDLARLDQLVSVDPVSRVAVFQAGVRGPDAERLLAEHGLTLGHLPQSFERATLGGFAATRSAGQASAGYGRFEEMVTGLRLATPAGEWRLGVSPASAAGPDLRQLVIGSEGAFGVITELALRVRPRPTARRYEGYALDGWSAGADAVRALAQAHVLADVTRLSDADETDVAFALRGGPGTAALRGYLRARGVREPVLLVLGWEAGSRAELARRRRATLRVLRGHGAVRLGRAVGQGWRHGRFAGPRQRDALLDAGVLVETLETATHWSGLDRLRDAVRDALADALTDDTHRPVVMCHVSHAYETGASLYFTVLAAQSKQPVEQWQRAKAAASAAITGLGTISHHHAVGTDHAPYLTAEIGRLGVDVLTAVKRTLDPTGVMNPGKLIPGPDAG